MLPFGEVSLFLIHKITTKDLIKGHDIFCENQMLQ